jgi:RHS repeat-associated protein
MTIHSRSATVCLFAAFLILSETSRSYGGGVVPTPLTEAGLNTALNGGGTVTFAGSGTITITNTKTISLDTVIDGSGQTVTISGGNAKRVFLVNPGVQFTVKNLTIANGKNAGVNGGNGSDGTPPSAGGNGGYGSAGSILNLAGTLTISGVTFVGNSALGGNAGNGGSGLPNAFPYNGASGGGGGFAYGAAIWNSNGVATITASVFTNNNTTAGTGGNGGNANNGGNGATGGSGGLGGSCYGGALYNSAGGVVTMTDCTFANNSANGGAGGLGGTSTGLSANSPGANGAAGSGNGSGIHTDGGAVTVMFSTINNNTSTGATGGNGKDGVGGNGQPASVGGLANGGGVFNNGGILTMTNCTIVANLALGGTGGNGGAGGAGSYNGGNGGSGGAATGGGVFTTTNGITTAGNCTITDNGAQGGFFGVGGAGTGFGHAGSDGAYGTDNGGGVAKGTGSFNLKNTLIGTSTFGGNGSGAITDYGNNLSDDASMALTATGSRTNVGLLIGALVNNGGLTKTEAIISTSSPAFDAGDDSATLITDQRHYYHSGQSDIGAYELNGTLTLVTIRASGPEASEDGDTGIFEVLRQGPTNSALTVNYSISGTARNGTDFATVSTSVSIPAGRYTEQIFVRPLQSTLPVTNATVVLTLSSTASYNAGWPSSATVMVADHSLINRTKRYFRGTGSDPTYQSFVVPVDYQRGVLLTNTGGNLTTLFPGNPWTTTWNHYNATNQSSETNLSARIPFNGPIVAFGSRVGGSSIYTGQGCTLGVYAGVNTYTNLNQIQIKAYNRSNFAVAGTLNIHIPQEFETNAWIGFATNGYSKTVSGNGLSTTISRGADPRWGAAWNHSYLLTHLADSTSTNYIYEVDVMGLTDRSWIVSNSSVTNGYSPLYTMEFESRPPWRATFVDNPQFEGSPMPPAYQGKSVQELLSLTNSPPVTNTVSLPQSPSYYTNLDNSPELRRHPVLDQLVSDMRKDPIALANYVINEIELTDGIHYNDNGSAAEESVNLGGVNRSALDTFQEGQGSPMEQCALLVYLMRQAGVPAVYVFPPHNGLKMLDVRLSKLLRMQVKGLITDADVTQTTNSLIAVNYPWVAAYVNGGWIHIFPWLKDTDLVEGLDIADYMPASYPNAYLWIKDYLYGKTNIFGVSTNSDQTPAVVFPKFLQQSLLQTAPGLSLDDIGMKDINRRNYYARWQDFSRPTWVTNTCTAVENLTDPAITNVFAGLTNAFDTVSIEISSDANPTNKIITGDLRMADLHNRKFLMRTDKVDSTHHNLILSLAAYRTNITSQSAFTNDAALLNKQLATNNLVSTDDRLTLKITHKRHRALPSSFNTHPPLVQDTFYEVSATDLFIDQRPLRKGDLAAICLNVGRVSRKMVNVHAAELWQMERTFSTNSSASVSADVYQGTVAYLMGMAYYERNSRFEDFLQRLYKARVISSYASGLSKLSPKRVGGQLPNGDVTLIQPNVDMFFEQATVAGNGSYRADVGRDFDSVQDDYFQLANLNASALEHEIINGYFQQYGAVSTVKLLQLAQSRSATNGQSGFILLNKSNYLSEGDKNYPTNGTTKLKNYDPNLWSSVVSAFNAGADADYTQVFITPGPVANASGSYAGMGALILAPNYGAGLISQANGGFGDYVPDASFTSANAQHISLQEDQNHDFAVNLSDPTPSAKTGAPDEFATFNTGEVAGNSSAGDYAFSQFQLLSISENSDLYKLTLQASPNQGFAQMVQFDEASGNLGRPGMADQLYDKVLDPVSAVSGDFYVDALDLALPGPMPLEIRRNYSSHNLADNQFGYGWKLNYMPYLSLNTNATVIYAAEMNGTVIAYQQTTTNANVWIPTLALNPLLDNNRTAGIGSTANLFRNRIEKVVGADTFYYLYQSDGGKRTFKLMTFNNGVVNATRPYLTIWQDNRGNYYTCEYGNDPTQPDYGQARRIQSSNGNYLGFYFDVYGHIIEAYTGDARRIQYEYDTFGDLVTVTLPDESQIGFEYDHQSLSITNGSTVTAAPYSTHLIVKEIKPDGRLLINQYDAQRRVTNQLATAGLDLNPIRNATFIYNNNFNLTNSFMNLLSGTNFIVDVFNNTNRYDYTNGLITKITDPLNQAIIQDWYEASETNKAGYYPRSLEFTIDKRGLKTTYQYDSNGNVTTATVLGELTGDGITNQQAITSTTYNPNSLPLLVTDPVGNSTQYIYHTNFVFLPQQIIKLAGANPVSTNLLAYYNVTNVFTSGGTTFTNVAFGLLQRGIRAYGSADAATSEWAYDGRGFIAQQTNYTGTTDPNILLSFFYNSRGQLVEQVDAANRTNRFDFDGLGRLKWKEVTDETGQRLGGEYSYYNDNGEVAWTDGPRSSPEDYVWRDYDGAGRKTTEIRWRSEAKYDGTGVQAPAGDDLYATTFYQYDPFGNLTRITDPLGNYVAQKFDAIGQMTNQVFYGANNVTLATNNFVYEPGGLVACFTNALRGVTKKVYTSTGGLKRQDNPDGSFNEWRYDLAGRQVKQTLQNTNYWQTVYDDLNRRVTKSFKNATTTLATNIVEFDRRGNLTKNVDLEGNAFTNSFDGLDRLKIAAGPAIVSLVPTNAPPNPKGSTSTTNQQVTTYTYDSSGKVLTVNNALGEKTVTTSDALGRPTILEVRNATNQNIRVTSNVYSTNHHSITVWQGTGANAIATTTYSDNEGNRILTVNYPASGVGEYIWQKYDRTGNRLALHQLSNSNAVLTVWATNGWTYDGLNRVATETTRDGAATSFAYNSLNNLTNRAMPNGLTWSATYLNDGRILAEKTAGGGLIERTNSYQYYASGNQWAGLLQAITDGRGTTRTRTYDDYLRPAALTTTGSAPEQQTTTGYYYDRRGLLTLAQQNFSSTNTGLGTYSLRVYDAYGRLSKETLNIGGPAAQNVNNQIWDSAGRRNTLWITVPDSFHFDFVYRADGMMSGNSGATFSYADNGLLVSRANSARSLTVNQRDGSGRLLQETITVNGQSVLAEILSWRNDGRLNSYTAQRGDFTNACNYAYSTLSQRLTQESFNVAAGQKVTNNYAFDLNTAGGLGVLTSLAASGQVSGNWSAPTSGGLDGLRRVAQEQNTVVKRTSTGKALGAATVAATLDSKPLAVQYAGIDSDGRWRSLLEMPPGSHTLRVWANHPSGQYTAYATNTFTLSATNGPDTAVDAYDSNGNVTQRVWKNSGGATNRVQSLTWDAFDRLLKVTDRDALNSGFNWVAVYDAFGRRLRTTYTLVVTNAPITSPSSAISVVDSFYDPEVEFLEVGVRVNGLTTWKVHGPDASGSYGGMQGVGGLETLWQYPKFTPTSVVQDYFGNALGGIKSGIVSWNSSRFGSYGPVPGYESPALSPNVAFSVATGWRGRRVDETGLVCLGARYYDPTAGRFLSADPLGHASDSSLFSFCGGDPVNYFDSDGRLAARSTEAGRQNPPPPYELGVAPYMQQSIYTDYFSTDGSHTGPLSPSQGIAYDPEHLAGHMYWNVTEPTGQYFSYVRDTRDGGALADPNYGKETWTPITKYDVENQQRLLYLKSLPMILLTLDSAGALLEGTGGRLIAGEGTLNSAEINFSQRTVSANVRQYANDMAEGNWDWSRSGPLRVMQRDSQWVSYDNRRLMAAQQAGLREVPVQVVQANEIMPGSNLTWEEAFTRRFTDPRNVKAGGAVPNVGLPNQPSILPPRR